ncbi:MAG TPA: hypothetical protein VG205_12285 [Acidimicrobiales bacterium]|jgi:hypothetical protein|nr:hypothetical protein [Acidimicrobiales bacterium]
MSLVAVAGTAAHHGFELGNGVGLVWQPELGLGGAGAVWTVQLGLWSWMAARGGRQWDRVLAMLAGSGMAGVVVHFILWPWKRNRFGIPALTEAEGLPASRLPAYNTILGVWGLTSALSLLELSPSRRRWALIGLVALPVFRLSARHHFNWAVVQSEENPAWWNRGFRTGSSIGAGQDQS